MPVVTIHALSPPDPLAREGCLARVARDLGRAIGRDPGQVWVYWCEVAAVHIGDAPRAFAGHCPLVEIRARSGRSEATVAAGLEAAGRAVAAALELPVEDVWVRWTDLPSGTVFAGGGVI